jgi:hypothetical protein
MTIPRETSVRETMQRNRLTSQLRNQNWIKKYLLTWKKTGKEESRTKNTRDKQTIDHEIVAVLNPLISTITLYINWPNTPIKRHMWEGEEGEHGQSTLNKCMYREQWNLMKLF